MVAIAESVFPIVLNINDRRRDNEGHEEWWAEIKI